MVKDRTGHIDRYPLFESQIGEVQVKSGNFLSSGALSALGFWNIPCLFLTQKGRPVAVLRSLVDDSHIQTRIAQYEASKSDKAAIIAKQLVISKFLGQDQVLQKYGLKRNGFSVLEKVKNLEASDPAKLRTRLMSIEGHYSESYFAEVFSLLSEPLRPDSRKTFKAYDGLNNVFNLCYESLAWKVYVALLNAKLEPYLGFLHSTAKGKPSLVCDFQELYRYLIDDFVIAFCQKLQKQDFVLKPETFSSGRKGKREYLNDSLARVLIRNLDLHFQSRISVPRIRVSERQEIETLINEEALLFAMYLRNEKPTWTPRIANFPKRVLFRHYRLFLDHLTRP